MGVSLLSATTPAALRKLAPKLPNDGLLQRLLLVIARPAGTEDGALYIAEVHRAREAYDARLRAIYGAPGGTVQLSAEAHELFEVERLELQQLAVSLESAHPSYAAHVAKRAAMLARVALTFHALGTDTVAPKISGETMCLASTFLRRQERHAWSIYSEMLGTHSALELARSIARAILAGRLTGFNRRELTPACKAFRAAEEPERLAALQLLDDAGWIACETHPSAHGASWLVYPAVHERFSSEAEAARARRELVRRRVFANAQERGE